MRRAQAAVATVLLCPALLLAIQTPQPPAFRSGVELIDVAVVVFTASERVPPFEVVAGAPE